MNRNFALALALAVAAVAAGNAFASDISPLDTPSVGSRTRADVQAELAQFKQSGVNPWSISYNQTSGFQSAKTREQVVAEYIASRDQVAALTREDSGSAFLARRHRRASVTIAAQ